MDYEQKYKESLERAKEWMSGKYGHCVSDTPQEIAEFIFPELKESEDKQIRKELIAYLKERKSCESYGQYVLRYDRWINLLEKQGKQKSQDKSALETINEEKVEPKFKVSKWYQCTKDFFGKGVTFDKNTAYYCAKEGCLQDEYGCHIAIVKDLYDNFKLWTIEDAKNGDVLVASDDSVFIFARVDGYSCIHHIALANDGVLEINPRLIFSWENVKGAKPATKEQRDLLFTKMHEAGYEWDADKRELTKE